ncbi:MAG TPA: beta-ketoacyl synthase N-terminal-like domain-containing protein, partial [Dissulfurispiraceae bacterium]|nr:beta-ketoacyl synthase N-terminal-like domain-containing protein [Dissulfurispiraceae bacterium]
MDDPIVITGMGIATSLGRDADEVWRALLSGATGIGPIRGFDASGFLCPLAAQIPDPDAPDTGTPSRDGRVTDSHTACLMKSARDACRQSHIDTVQSEDISFFAGMGMIDYSPDDLIRAVLHSRDKTGALDYDLFFSEGYREIPPLWPLAMLNNVIFCEVAINLGIRGENTVFSPHADSGARAVAEAMYTVREHPTGVTLAGGVSEKVSLSSLARAHLSGALSTGGG